MSHAITDLHNAINTLGMSEVIKRTGLKRGTILAALTGVTAPRLSTLLALERGLGIALARWSPVSSS